MKSIDQAVEPMLLRLNEVSKNDEQDQKQLEIAIFRFSKLDHFNHLPTVRAATGKNVTKFLEQILYFPV